MRRPLPDRVERARETTGECATPYGEDYGRFRLVSNDGTRLLVIASPGSDEVPWEHVSVSARSLNFLKSLRCPTWEEMAWIKSLFWNDDEAVVEYHPPKAEYVNHHPHCLHLWRPLHLPLPIPPSIAVGPRTAAEHEALRVRFR